ncbi:MAG TPA: metal ABC transporter permease [Solirubrobacterales bacterium]|jgi:ABC-type Mn2+/Zn2+ transport system permease subunit|nr:metal ABC transporter permease [Solirubrobacterales bacterium]
MLPLATSLLEPLRGDFGLPTAIELMLVGASCGGIGVWVVQFSRAFLAESFTHALLPGLVIATIAGTSLVLGALIGIALAYVATLAVERTPRMSPSSGTSVVVTGLVAAGALLATVGDAPVRLEPLLFGDPLATSDSDLALALGLAAALAAALFVMHNAFTACAFDRGAASGLGIRTAATNAVLVLLVVLAVAVAANVAGSLLALALVTGPALGALQIGRRIGPAIALSAAFGGACGVIGMYVSYFADWPLAASVALSAALLPATIAGAVRLRRLKPAVPAARAAGL